MYKIFFLSCMLLLTSSQVFGYDAVERDYEKEFKEPKEVKEVKEIKIPEKVETFKEKHIKEDSKGESRVEFETPKEDVAVVIEPISEPPSKENPKGDTGGKIGVKIEY